MLSVVAVAGRAEVGHGAVREPGHELLVLPRAFLDGQQQADARLMHVVVSPAQQPGLKWYCLFFSVAEHSDCCCCCGPVEMQSVTEVLQVVDRMSSDLPFAYETSVFTRPWAGDFKLSAVAQDHGAWMVCDGRSLDRTEYPTLFGAIGTAFGSDSASTFRIPDFRGRTFGSIGNGGGGLTPRSLGNSIGTETHTLTVTEMPNHNHGGFTSSAGAHDHGGSTQAAGQHTHTHNAPGSSRGLAFINGYDTPGSIDNDGGGELNVRNTTALVIDSAGNHQHAITAVDNHAHTISAQGAGQAHNNMQPTLFAGVVLIFTGKLRYTVLAARD